MAKSSDARFKMPTRMVAGKPRTPIADEPGKRTGGGLPYVRMPMPKDATSRPVTAGPKPGRPAPMPDPYVHNIGTSAASKAGVPRPVPAMTPKLVAPLQGGAPAKIAPKATPKAAPKPVKMRPVSVKRPTTVKRSPRPVKVNVARNRAVAL